MAQPIVDAGSIREYFLLLIRILPTAALRVISMDTAGHFLGRQIVGSYITARLRVPMGDRGANARNWCGGTRKRSNGLASTFPISVRTNLPTINLRPGPRAMPHLPGIVPSSCIQMDWDGYGCRRVWRMVLCRLITSHGNRRRAIRSTHSRRIHQP